jgi:3-methylcrotonyl-CoA carboxylase alpha subunit
VHLSAAQRATLFDASLRAARAVAYVGAGTVEFIIDRAGDVYFIEMNTRLQVEHPVTEAVTGCDLVEWQLRVAAGEPLPATQAELCCSGHAIEIRVYAEDPAQDFRPSTGTLDELALPNGIEGVRVDAGVTRGDAVTPHYDAMIAKIITTGATREAAVRCMQQALAATRIVGVNTNIAYLQRILAHPGYRAGGYSTHFVEEARATLLGRDEKVPDEVWLCAALALVAQVTTVTAGDTSPWARLAGFRLNGQHLLVHQLATPEQVCRATTELRGRGARVSIDERVFEISDYTLEAGRLVVRLASHILQARVVGAAHDLHVFLPTADLARSHYRLKAHDPWHEVEEADEVSGSLVAPMPGAVTAVLVAEGDKVAAGTALLVLEAMKIEHTLRAPFDGTVTALRYRAGEQVAAEGEELIRIERLA